MHDQARVTTCTGAEQSGPHRRKVPSMVDTTGPRPEQPSSGADGAGGPGFAVVQDEDARAYLAVEDGVELGAVTYEVAGDRLVLRATTVRPEHQGRGVGTRLGRAVLDRLVSEQRTVLVTCPFLRDLIDRHPEYAGLAATGPRRT